ncbi:MAG TPA: hypothetical protein PLX71_06365 [Phycicoccus sp.]|nr:hypothetical protein [Phycicoccus sp.]
MTLGLLTAVDHRHEADLVATLELAAGDVQVVRRCADIPELVSVAAAGTADVAVVSATFRGVDREVFRALAGHGVRVVGMCERSDEAGERRLRQLGVPAIIYPDTEIPELLHALHADDAGVDLALALAGAPNARPGEVGIPVTVSTPGLTAEGESDWGPSLSLGQPAEGLLAAGPDDDEEEAEPTPQGRVVAIWGPVGAPGRTTVAVNLAADLAAHDLSVVLIDADTWGACIGQTLGLIDEAPGLAAAARLSDQGNLDVLALARLTPEVSPGLRVLTGLPRADRWPEARAGAVTEIVTLARSLARWVIVDCGFALEDDEELSYDTVAPRRNAATLAVLEAADEVVVVGAADPVGLQRLVRGVQELAPRCTARRIVVVNKVRRSADGPAPERTIGDVLSRFSGLEDVHFLPWAPTECDRALWDGKTLVEIAPQAALTTKIGELATVLEPTRARPRRGRRTADPTSPSSRGRRGGPPV